MRQLNSRCEYQLCRHFALPFAVLSPLSLFIGLYVNDAALAAIGGVMFGTMAMPKLTIWEKLTTEKSRSMNRKIDLSPLAGIFYSKIIGLVVLSGLSLYSIFKLSLHCM